MQRREIRHEADENRYTLWVDNAFVGLTDYHLQGNDIVFTHTEVDPDKRHGGLGGVLVQGALDDVQRSTSHRVVAVCPFVADWIDAHYEYRELTERG
jgi:predicted GNAT family acetyltransferase